MLSKRNWFVYVVLMGLVFGGFAQSSGTISTAHAATVTQTNPTPPPSSNLQSASPLPGGCRGFTPGGTPEPVCCISGYVYNQGQPVVNAQVTITNQRGQTKSLTTSAGADSNQPYYRLNLSGELAVSLGEKITVTATYSGTSKTLTHVVQSGGQQVDIVLARNSHNDFRFEKEGIWSQLLAGQLLGPSDIAVDSNGNQYVVDTENARVQIYDVDGKNIAEIGTLGTTPTEWTFIKPSGIALGPNNKLYIVDTGNHRIRVFDITNVNTKDPKIAKATHWKTWGIRGSGNGQFNYPRDIAVDSQYVYVTDTGNNRVQKLTLEGVHKSTFGEYGKPTATNPANGKFDKPIGIATDGTFIYVADSGNNRIQKITWPINGVHSSTWGGTGSTTPGLFNAPQQVAIGISSVYVTEHNNSRIQQMSLSGSPLSVAGSKGSGVSQFNFYTSLFDHSQQYHHGIAVDIRGHVYVVDSGNGRIKKYSNGNIGSEPSLQLHHDAASIATKVQRLSFFVLDGNGKYFVLDNWTQRVHRFEPDQTRIMPTWQPGGYSYKDIAVQTDGYIYVVNETQKRVQRYTQSGVLDATLSGTQFYTPTGVVVDSVGNIYVIDNGNKSLQKFAKNGAFLAQWTTFGSNNETFWHPTAIATNAYDHIYILDGVPSGQQRVLKFNTGGSLITQANNLYSSAQIAADDNGYVYVHRINQLGDSSTKVSTIYQLDSTGKKLAELTSPTIVTHLRVDGRRHKIHLGMDYSSIKTFALPTFTKPIATIVHSSHAGEVENNRTFVLKGMGQDSDTVNGGMAVAYRWTLDGNELTNKQDNYLELTPAELTLGTHRIRFAFRDDDGEWSESVEMTINVTQASSPNAEWTFLLHLDADHDDQGALKADFNRAINGLKSAAAAGILKINVAVQLDGPGNNDTERVLISKTGTVTPVAINEQAMDSPQTLSDFVKWGQSAFPNTYYYLAVADHGQGILGISWDHTSDLADGVADSSAYLSVKELAHALSDPAIEKIHVLHLDACSMGLLEAAYELRGVVDILIASQYLAWSYFGYDQYAKEIQPTSTITDVAQIVVNKYANGLSGEPFTISALNLAYAASVSTKLNELAAAIRPQSNTYKATLQGIRASVQTLVSDFVYSGFSNDAYDIYVDLKDWATLVRDSNLPGEPEANALLTELQNLIIITRSASTLNVRLEKAYGISMIYPFDRSAATLNQYFGGERFDFASVADQWIALVDGLQPLNTGTPVPTTVVTPLPPQELSTTPPMPTFTPTPTSTPTFTPTPTPTSTPTPASANELIFADGFETGGLAPWSTSTTDSGDLLVAAPAALVGTQGMQAVLDDNNAIYVTDTLPNAEKRYRSRFYFDPNSIKMASGNNHYIFYGYQNNSTVVLRIEFRFYNAQYQFRVEALNDSTSWKASSFMALSDAPHVIEVDWRAATAPAANDGGLNLWLDGTQKVNLTSIDNDTRRIDQVRLGAIAGMDTGTRGSYFFDAFESRRQTYMGPVTSVQSAAVTVDEPEVMVQSTFILSGTVQSTDELMLAGVNQGLQFSLRLPAQAVSLPVTVTLVTTDTHTMPDGYHLMGDMVDLQVLDYYGTKLTAFDAPIMITIDYRGGTDESVIPSSLSLHSWNAEGESWEMVPTITTTDNYVLSAQLNRPLILAVMQQTTDETSTQESFHLYLPAIQQGSSNIQDVTITESSSQNIHLPMIQLQE